MNAKKRDMTLGFFALVYGLILLLVMINGLAASIKQGHDGWTYCYMFTYQSNFLILIWLIGWGVTRFIDKESGFKRFVDNRTVITALTVYISITFFIVAFVLNSVFSAGYLITTDNAFFVHFATPIVMWIYFFLVSGRGETKYRNAWYILIYPFIYVMINLIIGGTVKWAGGDSVGQPAYAYGFIAPNSYPNVFVYILVLLMLIAIFGGFGVLLILFKKFLVKHYYEKDKAGAEGKASAKA